LGPFATLGLNETICRAIARMGYRMPTPIQRQCIRHVLEGKDVVAMARTGSGKTAAFLAPLVQKLGSHSQSVGARGVILSPTRELAMQTATFCRQLCRFTDLRLCVLVGGSGLESQFEKLANNPDILIAAPGRLAHHIIEAGLSLKVVEMIVFDEADKLFENGFEDQLKKIMSSVSPARQCVLMSATLSSQLVQFSRLALREPLLVRLNVEHTLSDDLDLWFLYVREDEKIACLLFLLRRVLAKEENAVVFVATRHHVEFFSLLLAKAGISTASVYGSMDQTARVSAVTSFRKGYSKVLVVTDVAARGLDIPMLDTVIHFDCPASSKLFVHRAGRTARAGRAGVSISLIGMSDIPYIVELLLFLGKHLRILDSESAASDLTPKKDEVFMAGVPTLSEEIESVERERNNSSELQGMFKTMMRSYQVYNKTRPAASKQSARRGKELIDEAGGIAKLWSSIHPSISRKMATLQSADSFVTPQLKILQNEKERRAFIDNLRRFRPQSGSKTSVITSKTSSDINRRRYASDLRNFSTLAEGKTPRNDFYLSTEISTESKAKEEGLASTMDKLKVVITPDEDKDMKKAQHVMKWDTKKKKIYDDAC